MSGARGNTRPARSNAPCRGSAHASRAPPKLSWARAPHSAGPPGCQPGSAGSTAPARRTQPTGGRPSRGTPPAPRSDRGHSATQPRRRPSRPPTPPGPTTSHGARPPSLAQLNRLVGAGNTGHQPAGPVTAPARRHSARRARQHWRHQIQFSPRVAGNGDSSTGPAVPARYPRQAREPLWFRSAGSRASPGYRPRGDPVRPNL